MILHARIYFAFVLPLVAGGSLLLAANLHDNKSAGFRDTTHFYEDIRSDVSDTAADKRLAGQ
jgi:hypothetical protein